jgi:hypothetical protein
MKQEDTLPLGCGLAVLLLVLFLVVGWVANIIRLCGCDFREPYKAEIIRAVGVFVPPVGCIVGYIDVGE